MEFVKRQHRDWRNREDGCHKHKEKKSKIYEPHFLLFILGNSTRKPKLILRQFLQSCEAFSPNNFSASLLRIWQAQWNAICVLKKCIVAHGFSEQRMLYARSSRAPLNLPHIFVFLLMAEKGLYSSFGYSAGNNAVTSKFRFNGTVKKFEA